MGQNPVIVSIVLVRALEEVEITLPECSSIDPCCRLAVRPWGYRRCPQSNPNLWWPQKLTSRSWTSWARWKSWPWACPQQWGVNRTSHIGKTHWKKTHIIWWICIKIQPQFHEKPCIPKKLAFLCLLKKYNKILQTTSCQVQPTELNFCYFL